MCAPHAKQPMEENLAERLRRYLPPLLHRRWQAGEPAPALEHLQKTLSAVLTYLPRHVVKSRLADPDATTVSGTFTRSTLIFADISGFTAMSERLAQLGREGAEVVTDIVNDYFGTMLEIIAEHGGDLFKFGGDALLVSFFSQQGAEAQACRAALAMQRAMARFAVVERPEGTFNLRVKIGLGTGDLFLTSLGSTLRQEYSVMGDVVNLAARLMGVAAEGEVIVSQATARQVEGLFTWQEREPVQVKGERRPVPNYLISRRIIEGEERAIARRDFFGRRPELASARELLDVVLDGRGAVLDLSGERGIGKSRLVEELNAYARERGMRALRGEALSYGRNVPYLPWLDVLRALFGLQKDASPQSRRDRLSRALHALGLSDWAPIVGEVLGIDLPETPLTASPPGTWAGGSGSTGNAWADVIDMASVRPANKSTAGQNGLSKER